MRARENAAHSRSRRRRVTRPQCVAAPVLLGLMTAGDKPGHRQVAPSVVVPVEDRQLLRPMGRVIGRIEIGRKVSSVFQ